MGATAKGEENEEKEVQGFRQEHKVDWARPTTLYFAGSLMLDGGSTLWALEKGAGERNRWGAKGAAVSMFATASVLVLMDVWLQTKGSRLGWRVLRVISTVGFLAIAAHNILIGVRVK